MVEIIPKLSKVASEVSGPVAVRSPDASFSSAVAQFFDHLALGLRRIAPSGSSWPDAQHPTASRCRAMSASDFKLLAREASQNSDSALRDNADFIVLLGLRDRAVVISPACKLATMRSLTSANGLPTNLTHCQQQHGNGR
jgi:hypothetical protein